MFKLVSGIYGICNDSDWELSQEQQGLICQLYMSVMGEYLNNLTVVGLKLKDGIVEPDPIREAAVRKLLERSTEYALKFLIDPNSVKLGQSI